uniref:Uncharacterized protein n=1 Tax=Planktothricoides sp. SpSt-374 TaxID=2282167 RepID=A0A7C3ZT13_9CYAN
MTRKTNTDMNEKILLVTVGASPAPIVTAIQNLQPDRVIFFCNEKYQDQIIGEGLPCQIIKGKIVINSPNIPTITRLGNRFDPTRDLKIIQNSDDLTECYHLAGASIRHIQESNPECQIYADYTGGTKTMSLGLALAALENGISLQVNSPVSLTTVTHSRLPLPFLDALSKKFLAPKKANSITAFHVSNFKAFADMQYIPIRPLTLIYGANSSGKSSVIHSLLLANHAIKSNGELDIYRTEAGGDSVDLGGFGQYVHRRDRRRQVEWAVDIDPKQLNLPDPGLGDLLQSVNKLTVGVGIGTRRSGNGRVRVRSFFIEADGSTVLNMSSRPRGRLQLDSLDYKHPIVSQLIEAIVQTQTFALNVTAEVRDEIEQVVNELVPEITARVSRLLPTKIKVGEDGDQPNLERSLQLGQGDLADTVRLVFPYRLSELIGAIADTIERELGRLQYLGPFRTYPPRHFAFSRQQDTNWYAGGGYAWDILLNNGEVRGKVNAWLGDKERMKSPYELVVRHLLPDSQLAAELYPRIAKGFHDLTTKLIFHAAGFGGDIQEQIERLRGDLEAAGIDLESLDTALPEIELLVSMLTDVDSLSEEWVEQMSAAGDPISDLVLIDKRTKTPVSHRDIGIGVSQVIPILVSCYGLSNGLVAIEQPEIHLHPKLQAELGDVFIESALGEQKNVFLLETHSEHLLLRIMRRMRETFEGRLPKGMPPVRPEDVCVLFVEPDAKGSIVREMPLNKRGELVKAWPGGFFEEEMDEIF